MPVQSVSLSNENYEFLRRRADVRRTGFSRVINDLITDTRLLEQAKRKKNE